MWRLAGFEKKCQWMIRAAWKKGPWLLTGFFGRWTTAQLYGDYFLHHDIRIPLKQPEWPMESKAVSFFVRGSFDNSFSAGGDPIWLSRTYCSDTETIINHQRKVLDSCYKNQKKTKTFKGFGEHINSPRKFVSWVLQDFGVPVNAFFKTIFQATCLD